MTVPTDRMRQAMYRAEVGDDVWNEDPTVKALEALAAERVGKEAALFVPSGTMGNQLAAMTHMDRRGMEVIVEADSHIFYYEVGGLAVLAGAQVRAIAGAKGMLSPESVQAAIRPTNLHMPVTGLLCLENTHNRAGGTIMGVDQVDALADVAHGHGVPVHVDGARLFNASVALGVDPARIVQRADSVMFCLSKGLGAPVGSVLAGSEEFVRKAHRNRKMLGGGMRQVGIIASAGIIALTEMVERLADDHEMARELALGLSTVPGISLDLATVQTNIVCFDVGQTGLTGGGFVEALALRGILTSEFGPSVVRMVTHKDVPAGSAEIVVSEVRSMLLSVA